MIEFVGSFSARDEDIVGCAKSPNLGAAIWLRFRGVSRLRGLDDFRKGRTR